MHLLARVLRAVAKARFRVLGLATIKDIPSDRFNGLVHWLIAHGWTKTSEYDGFDAWIDYGHIVLKRGHTTLSCEWDNWTEGSIEGPRAAIVAIAQKHADLDVTDA